MDKLINKKSLIKKRIIVYTLLILLPIASFVTLFFGATGHTSILLLALSFLIPLAGITAGIIYFNKGTEYKTIGKAYLSVSIFVITFQIVLILIVAPKFMEASRMAKRGMAGMIIDIFATQLENYYANYKCYPLTSEGLARLETAGYLSLKSEKKSARGVPIDPWGNEFYYTSDGQSFTIVSYGADGKPGGTGDAKDIRSDEFP